MQHRRLPAIWNFASLVLVIVSLPGIAFALSVAGGAKWGTPGNNGKVFQLGPTNTQTCALAGVSGNFLGNPYVFSSPGEFLPASASVRPDQTGQFWIMETRAGLGAGVAAQALCINTTANRTTFGWSSNVTSAGVEATPNRHCFLSEVWATTGLSGQHNGLVTNLTIRKIGNQFDLNSSFVEAIGGDQEFGGATATCVDIVPTQQWGYTFIGPTNGANAGIAVVPLRDSYPNGNPVPVAGVGCFLTGISGRWISPVPDPIGWNDGAVLAADSSSPPNWQITVTNGRQATVSCLK